VTTWIERRGSVMIREPSTVDAERLPFMTPTPYLENGRLLSETPIVFVHDDEGRRYEMHGTIASLRPRDPRPC
jgi:hypothetical protein